jgi:hypothetical protein
MFYNMDIPLEQKYCVLWLGKLFNSKLFVLKKTSQGKPAKVCKIVNTKPGSCQS